MQPQLAASAYGATHDSGSPPDYNDGAAGPSGLLTLPRLALLDIASMLSNSLSDRKEETHHQRFHNRLRRHSVSQRRKNANIFHGLGAVSERGAIVEDRTKTTLEWGLRYPPLQPLSSERPQVHAVVSNGELVANVGTGKVTACDLKELQQRFDHHKGAVRDRGALLSRRETLPPRPPLKLPRPDSAAFRRKLTQISSGTSTYEGAELDSFPENEDVYVPPELMRNEIGEQALADQSSRQYARAENQTHQGQQQQRRQRKPVSISRKNYQQERAGRQHSEILGEWLDIKLREANRVSAEADSLQLKTGVIDTVLDELVSQVKAHTRDRGVLLEHVLQLHKQLLSSMHSTALVGSVNEVQKDFRERMIRLTSTQKKDAESLLEEKKEMWMDCNSLRNELKARDSLIAMLNADMKSSLASREQRIKHLLHQEQQLQEAKQVLHLTAEELNEEVNESKMRLKDVKAELRNTKLDLSFALDRELSTKQHIEKQDELILRLKERLLLLSNAETKATVDEFGFVESRSPVADITQLEKCTVNERPSQDFGEEYHRAATKIQSLVRGRLSRRTSSRHKREAVHTKHQVIKDLQQKAVQEHGLPLVLPTALKPLFHAPEKNRREHFVHVQTRKRLIKWIGQILFDKPVSDEQALSSGLPRLNFADYVYQYHISSQGFREPAENTLYDLVANLELYRSESSRVRLFTRFLDAEVPERIIDYAIMFMEALGVYASGPLKAAIDNSQGICWVDVASVCQIVELTLGKFDESIRDKVLRRMRSRSCTQSIARKVAGMSRPSFQGTDQFMSLDDCMELIVNGLEEQDTALSAILRRRFVEYSENTIGLDEDEGGLPLNISLKDFGGVLREFKEGVSDMHLAFMFRSATSRAHKRDVNLDDFVASAREGGILPLPVELAPISNTISYRVFQATDTNRAFEYHQHILQLTPSAVSLNDGFGVLGSLRVEVGQEIVDVERARGGASSGSSSEHTRMLEARIDLLREQVVDTANLWKKKLQRMQEKYDSVSSMLRAEYETKMEKMKRDYGTNRTVLVESIQQSHAKKLQVLFEKFERRKRHFDSTSGKLRSHVQTLSGDFRRVSKVWEREKEDLTRAIEELSAKLAFEREQSHIIVSEVQRHMQSQVVFLQKAITLRSMDLQRMQRSVECSLMSAEDMRTRVYSLTARFLHLQKENSMLRRASRARPKTQQQDRSQILVQTIPPTRSIAFKESQSLESAEMISTHSKKGSTKLV